MSVDVGFKSIELFDICFDIDIFKCIELFGLIIIDFNGLINFKFLCNVYIRGLFFGIVMVFEEKFIFILFLIRKFLLRISVWCKLLKIRKVLVIVILLNVSGRVIFFLILWYFLLIFVICMILDDCILILDIFNFVSNFEWM